MSERRTQEQPSERSMTAGDNALDSSVVPPHSPGTISPFNDGWQFRRGSANATTAVVLPHDAMIGEPRSPQAASGNHGGYFPGGRYTYSRRWEAPLDCDSRAISLLFEGVYGATTVSMDGRRLAGWDSGYREVRVALDGVIRPGQVHEITVEVDNTDVPNSRWYTGSGIYRPVWIENLPTVHLQRESTRLVTLRTAPTAAVALEVHTVGTLADGQFTVHATLATPAGEVAAEGSAAALSPATILLGVNDPALWSADDPQLYQLSIELRDRAGGVVDQHLERVGIRSIDVDAVKGLRINGEQVLLRGACVHHDNGILGAATHAAAEHRRARILKSNGFNAVRSAHNPLSRAFLDACDEIGLYVMDELTDTWYDPKTEHDASARWELSWHEDMKAMVEKDRRRASVIMYSVGNEVAETASARGISTTGELAAELSRLDSSRPNTLAINFLLNFLASFGSSPFRRDKPAPDPATTEPNKPSPMTSTAVNAVAAAIGPMMQRIANLNRADRFTRGALAKVDIAGYNYAYLRYRKDRSRYPSRIILGSESMPGDIERIWASVQQIPGVIGDFMWTGWDYLGEAGIGTWSYDETSIINKPFPELLAGAGVIDITGVAGAGALLAQATWGLLGAPQIAVRPLDVSGKRVTRTPWRRSDAVTSWGWAGYDGHPSQIEVYSDADEVELIVGDESLGRKKTGATRGHLATFTVAYRSRPLTAIGYRNGLETGRSTLLPVGQATVALRTEGPEPTLPTSDVRFVWIELADTDGTVDSAAADTVSVSVEGGELLGLGSAAPRTTGSFTDSTHETYHGRALAIIRLADLEHGAHIIVTTDDHGTGTLDVW